jgi:hypothetical protein
MTKIKTLDDFSRQLGRNCTSPWYANYTSSERGALQAVADRYCRGNRPVDSQARDTLLLQACAAQSNLGKKRGAYAGCAAALSPHAVRRAAIHCLQSLSDGLANGGCVNAHAAAKTLEELVTSRPDVLQSCGPAVRMLSLMLPRSPTHRANLQDVQLVWGYMQSAAASAPAPDATLEAVQKLLHLCLGSKIQNLLDRQPDAQETAALATLLRSMRSAGTPLPTAWQALADWRPHAPFTAHVSTAPPNHGAQTLLSASSQQLVKKLTHLWGPATRGGFDTRAAELLAALPNVTVLQAKTFDLGGLSFAVAGKSPVIQSITDQLQELTRCLQDAFVKGASSEPSLCLLFNQLCSQGTPSKQYLEIMQQVVGLAEAQRRHVLRLINPLTAPRDQLNAWKQLSTGPGDLRPLASLLTGPRDKALRALQTQAAAAPHRLSAQNWVEVADGCRAMASLVATPPAWMQPFLAWDPTIALGGITACLRPVIYSHSALTGWLTDALYLHGPAAESLAKHFGCSLLPGDAKATKLVDTHAVGLLPRATEAMAVFQALRDCQAACAVAPNLADSLAETGEAKDVLTLLQGVTKLPAEARQQLVAAYLPPAGATAIEAASLWGKFFRYPAVQQAAGHFLRVFDAWWHRVHGVLRQRVSKEINAAQATQRWAGLAPHIKNLLALKRAAPHALPELNYSLLHWQVDPKVVSSLEAVATLCTDPAERNCDLLCRLLGPAQGLTLACNGQREQVVAALDAPSALAVLGTAPQKETGLYSLTLSGATLRFVVEAGSTPKSTVDSLLATVLPSYLRATGHPAEHFRAVLLNGLLSRAAPLRISQVVAATQFVAAADAETCAVMQRWVGQLGNSPQADGWAFSALVQHFERAAATAAERRHVLNLCTFADMLGFERLSGAPQQFVDANTRALWAHPVLDARGVTHARANYAAGSTAAEPLPDRTLRKLIEAFRSGQYDSLRSLLSCVACCPLSGSRLVVPVVAADGYAYERSMLQAWLRHSQTSPVTGQPLESVTFVPHLALGRLLADCFGAPVQAAQGTAAWIAQASQALVSETKYYRGRAAWAIKQALASGIDAAASTESVKFLRSKAALLEPDFCLHSEHASMGAEAAGCITVRDEQTADLQLRVDDLSALQRRGLGLLSAQPLIVRLQFKDNSSEPPRFQIAQGHTVLATTVANGTWLSVAPPADSVARQPLKATSRATYALARLLSQHLAGLYKEGRASVFLEDTFTVLQGRLRSLAQHCMACDVRHACSLYQPGFCERPACAAELNKDLPDFFYEELRQQPSVADLLLSMTYAAANPRLAHTHTVFFQGSPLREHQEIQRLLKQMPSFAALQKVDNLRQHLDAIDPQMAPLLAWIMRTNRGYLLQAPPELRLPSQSNAHQFVLPHMDAARETAFQQHKSRRGGSEIFFHGTKFDRLHSIVRNGLAVYSHQPLQTSGAYYGSGIYLSPEPNTALTYGSTSHSSLWPQSTLGDSPTCLLVCEVARGAAIRKAPSISTLRDPSAVAVRFVLIYPQSSCYYTSGPYAQMAAEARRALNQFADPSLSP